MDHLPNQKHACLIMAHNHFSQLQTLIALLDDPLNDIYLHVDKKATAFQPERIQVRQSKLVMVDRISVQWGGDSQIACELNLLKASVPNHYQYYHLLSGLDLPLKTQAEIHAFFDSHYPKSFLEFDSEANRTGSFLYRMAYYHFLQNSIGRDTGFWGKVLDKLETCSVTLQKKAGFQRKQYIPAYKGTNWFSITDALAQYVLSQEALIKKQFYHSVCADEIFLHSVAMASPYREQIVDNCLRAIDWTRGEPYVYRWEDVEELLSSENLFGRKFDSDVDCRAIEKVIAHLSGNREPS